MKKISLLMSLATVLVVGGVYATWSYSQGDVAQVETQHGVGITTETHTGTKGTLNVVSNNVSFIVGNKGNYVPELRIVDVVDVEEEVTFTFTPSVGAEDSAIDVNWSLSVDSNWKYSTTFGATADKSLFTVVSTETKIEKEKAVKKGSAYTYKITASEILSKITLNIEDGFVLDTLSKYTNFKEWLDDYKFNLTISEAK